MSIDCTTELENVTKKSQTGEKMRLSDPLSFFLCVSASHPLQFLPCSLSLLPLFELLSHLLLPSSPFISSYWRNAKVSRKARYERHCIPVCSAVSRCTLLERQAEARDLSGDRWEQDKEESTSHLVSLDFSFSCSQFLMLP